MKNVSIACLLLLTSCGALIRHKEDFKTIGHDVIDEEVDQIVEEVQPSKEKWVDHETFMYLVLFDLKWMYVFHQHDPF